MYLIDSYSSFMNYYLFYFRCTYYSVSVICDYIYLLYMFSFAKFKLTTRYFEQFNSGMSVYLYTYNGCEWSKIPGPYSWYQSSGSSRQNLTYRVNVFTESLSFEFQSLPSESISLIFGTFPTVPNFIRVPHYSSPFNSGAPHNSILNDIYNRSAVSPNFE